MRADAGDAEDTANTERSFETFLPPHFGQSGLPAPEWKRSNFSPQSRQAYSKSGIARQA